MVYYYTINNTNTAFILETFLQFKMINSGKIHKYYDFNSIPISHSIFNSLAIFTIKSL